LVGRSRGIAGTVTVCLLATGVPAGGTCSARAQTNMRVQAVAEPDASPTVDHLLRDAVPATAFSLDPPDSTADDFVLPEEKEKKQLVKEIAVWTIAVVFLAFFIVKVFIEEDDEPAEDDGGGKDVPPPQ
jgi:hypothetical protein